MHRRLKYIGVLALLLAAPAAQAQFIDTEPLRLTVSPEMPGPGAEVRLEVQGVGSFVGDALITWRVNGNVEKSGVGERTFTFTTGALGSVSRVTVTVNSPTEGVFTLERTFVPSSVQLLWEARTYTPPFYRGKALYTPGATVTVTAFPQIVANGRTISSNNLSFRWSRNGNAVPEASGLGRSAFTFTGDQLKTSEAVRVDVYAGDTLVGRGSTVIPAASPQLQLYVRDPLRGTLFDQALPSTVSLQGREITLEAVPYFFSTESLANDTFVYRWELNGRSTAGPETDRGILTLRQSGEGTGSARIGVSLQNTDGTKLLQTADTGLRIIFGVAQSGAGSLFDL